MKFQTAAPPSARPSAAERAYVRLRGWVRLLSRRAGKAARHPLEVPVEEAVPVFRACYDRIDRCVDALAGLWDARA